MYCEKGIGQDHAKWSPVAPAHYRLMPKVTIKEEITGAEAVTIKEKCPMGVFDIEDLGREKRLVVKDSRKCNACRECLRDTKDRIELAKIKNHFECISLKHDNPYAVVHVESVGIIPAEEIFIRACNVLKEKANDWLNAFNAS